jgi:hypothetical protein
MLDREPEQRLGALLVLAGPAKLARTVSAGRVVSAASVSVAIGVSAPRKRMRQP